MITSAKTPSFARFLFLLLCITGCDHVWPRFAGPNELEAATPTMHDDGEGESLGKSKLCCSCIQSCTGPHADQMPQ